MITPDMLKKMRGASLLLPPPGGEVVTECIDEIDRLRSVLSEIAGQTTNQSTLTQFESVVSELIAIKTLAKNGI